MLRDFSETSKNRLLSYVSQVENGKLCDFTDWIGDRWYDLESWIGTLNIKNYINNVNLYHQKVIDKNNTTKETIERIFNNVKKTDIQYGIDLKYTYVETSFVEKYVQELKEIINPSKGLFTSEYIAISMSEKLRLYAEFMNEKSGSAEDMYPDLIEVDLTSLFLGSRDSGMDIVTMGWTRDWLADVISSLGVGDSSTEIAIRKSIEALLAELIKDSNNSGKTYEEFISTFTPKEMDTVKEILGIFNDTSDVYTEEQWQNIVKSIIEKNGMGDSENLTTLFQTGNLGFLRKLSGKLKDVLGKYGDAINSIDTAANFVMKIFSDYTEDKKYLELIKQALINSGYDNGTVNKVVDDMLWDYENQYLSAVIDVGEKKVQALINGTVDKVFPLLNIFLATKDLTNSITGLDNTADNILNIYTTNLYSGSILETYEFYRQKILSGNYTENDIQHCKAYFEMARLAKLSEYRSIKIVIEAALGSAGTAFVDSEDEQYTRDMLVKVEEEIERLENLTIYG